MKKITKKSLIFIIIFAIIGFVALQIPVFQIIGASAKFTIYDAFAPTAAAFIGSLPGVIAVFLMQLFNFLFHGAQIDDIGTIIRFFPMLFAVLYFAKKGSFNLIIPAIAIVAFVSHPIGQKVWYFSLFWIIPIAAYFLREKFLLARALGTTFTAHAVGSTLWLWAFNLPASVWQALIPVVLAERFLFALGIAGSFVLLNNLLAILEKKKIFNFKLFLEQKYLAPSLRK